MYEGMSERRGKIMKNYKKITAFMVTGITMMMTVLSPMSVYADRVDEKPYISLGADLTTEQRATVLGLMDVKESELADYTVVTITNADEHQYLDSYLSSDVIGTRALSCAKVIGKDDGYGIKVTTQNISYCTIGMYQNALATAGLENADITVVGPTNISGTAALVGAIKAYASMTGESVSEESVDTATNELVLTAQLADDIGDSDKAEELVGAVKDAVVSNDLNSEEQVLEAVETAANELDVQLSEEDKQQITDLMGKVDDLDLDIDSLKEQASDLYDKLQGVDLDSLGITSEDLNEAEGFLANLWEDVKNFFANLFN